MTREESWRVGSRGGRRISGSQRGWMEIGW